MKRQCSAILVITIALALPFPGSAQERGVPAPPADSVEITLYRAGPAEVLESRPLALAAPARRLLARHLPAGAESESLSAWIAPVGEAPTPARSVAVQEAEASESGLLRRLIGREIAWLTRNPASGAEEVLTGVLRAASGGRPVVERDGALEVLPAGRLRLDPAPAGLALTRTAAVEGAAPAGASRLLLRYRLAGMNWDARYEAVLAEDGRSLRLQGAYLLRNAGPDAIRNAAVTLVAGDVPRVAVPGPRPMRAEAVQARGLALSSDAGPPQAAATGDRQVYRLEGAIDLPAASTLRRVLIAPSEIPAERRYVLEGRGEAWPGPPAHRAGGAAARLRPRVEVAFENAADGPLGAPLPAGVVAVRAPAPGGADAPATLLLAEAALPATAVGERVVLDLGEAFDVSARRRLTEYREIGAPDPRTGRRAYEAAHEIRLLNAKEMPVTVEIVERFGGEWRILDASREPAPADAEAARFRLDVPAGGEAALTYRVRVGG